MGITDQSLNLHLTGIEGLTASNGNKYFPGLSNTFENENRLPWYQKKLLTVVFALVLVVQTLVLYDFTMNSELTELSFTDMNTFDLGALKPTTRKTVVIEIDEVFGNQYVKKKEIVDPLSAIATTDATGDGDFEGEGLTDLSFSSGIRAPRFITRPKRNFPKIAEDYVSTATVTVEMIVDDMGRVRKVVPLYVELPKALPKELEKSIKQAFKKAAVDSVSGQRMSVTYINGKAIPVKFELPLVYELQG